MSMRPPSRLIRSTRSDVSSPSSISVPAKKVISAPD
jgi:hypothetical protein